MPRSRLRWAVDKNEIAQIQANDAVELWCCGANVCIDPCLFSLPLEFQFHLSTKNNKGVITFYMYRCQALG